MDILLCNGSPKAGDSASSRLLKQLEEAVGERAVCRWVESRKTLDTAVEEELEHCDALVVAFPLYVDAIPGHLLCWMERAESALRRRERPPTLYTVCQCGFFEARQNHIALRMMRQWCECSGMAWGQALGIGAGPMLQAAPIGKGPWSRLGAPFDEWTENMLGAKSGEDRMVEPSFPRALYKMAGNMGWNREAKKNGLAKKELYRRVGTPR